MAGFNIRKHLKAYVRYDGTGRIVAGSLVLAESKPKNGDWVEIPAYECCDQPGISCNSFWINQTVNPDNPGGVYAVGSGIDSQCNTFMLIVDYWASPNNPNQDTGQNFLLQKFNDAGNLVWNKVFTFAEDGTTFNYIDPQTIIVDKEDNIICFFVYFDGEASITGTAVVKFDNDGNQLWSKYTPMDTNRWLVTSVAFDALNNIYICLFMQTFIPSYKGFVGVEKISPEGVILASKTIEVGGNDAEGYINVNSSGEVYVVCTDKTGFPRNHYVIKLDSSLNEIWNKKFENDNNTYLFSVVLDRDENIVFQIGNGAIPNPDPVYGAYVKMSPQGDIIWTTRINNTTDPQYSLGTFQLNSDSDGNIYISSVYISDIPNYPDTNNSLIVAKLSTAGAFEWAYFVQPPSGNNMDSWWWSCPIMGTVKNNSLVLGYYDNNDPFNAQLLKLPLTPVADGVYGDYTFTNITADWTTSSPEIVLTDGTVTYEDGPTDTQSLTYLPFEWTYTTINTPL